LTTDSEVLTPGHNRFGFGWAYDPRLDAPYGFGPNATIVVPYAAISLLSGMMSLYFAIVCRRYSLKAIRRARGLCFRCGYDILATPRQCPECGTTQAKT
jgi:hypothetical protein